MSQGKEAKMQAHTHSLLKIQSGSSFHRYLPRASSQVPRDPCEAEGDAEIGGQVTDNETAQYCAPFRPGSPCSLSLGRPQSTHFTDRHLRLERVSDLPKVTQLVRRQGQEFSIGAKST